MAQKTAVPFKKSGNDGSLFTKRYKLLTVIMLVQFNVVRMVQCLVYA